MWSPASAEITVPTNNNPLPRGPHTCYHTTPQSPETHLPLSHPKAPSSKGCIHRHTHTYPFLPFPSLAHTHTQLQTQKGYTQMCPHCIASNTLTSAKFLSAHLCSHTCTHTHANGGKVCGTELSPKQQPCLTETHPHLPGGEGGGRHVSSPGYAPSSHIHSLLSRVPAPVEACPGPRVQHAVHSLESLAS